MPMRIEELDDGRGVQVVGSGDLGDREYYGAVAAHLGAEDVGKYRYSFADFTAVDSAHVTSHSVQRVADLAVGAERVRSDIVIALVADHDLTFGLSRMWQMFAERTGWTIKVFRDRPEAEAWLRDEVAKRWGERPALVPSGHVVAEAP